MKRALHRAGMVSFITTNFVLTGYPAMPPWLRTAGIHSGQTQPILANLAKPNKAAKPAAKKITVAQIQAIVQAMQTAANRKDVRGIIDHMAPNAIIEGSTRILALNQVDHFRVNREEYHAKLIEGYASTETYQGTVSQLTVKVAADGKSAVASFTLTESATLKNLPTRLNSRSQETMRFELIGGKALMTAAKIQSQVKLQQ